MTPLRILASILVAILMLAPAPAGASCAKSSCATVLTGTVASGFAPDDVALSGFTVTVYEAQKGKPKRLASAITAEDGTFLAAVPRQKDDEVRYAIARRGSVELMTVITASDNPSIRINETTTVASAYAFAQFFDGSGVRGSDKPLMVAAGMFRNLADPGTGSVSTVLQSAPNADQTNAMRLMATLSNMLAGCTRNDAPACSSLFDLTQSQTTLEAARAIARNPVSNVQDLFDLSLDNEVYAPALTHEQGPSAEDEWQKLDGYTLAVKINVTGIAPSRDALCPFGGPGNIVFDQNGYAWVTNNVVQGSPVSAECFYVFKPNGQPSDGTNGTPLSPLSGGGVLGQGFGITIDPKGFVWAGNFGWGGDDPVGSVSKFSPAGEALSPSSGYVNYLDRVQGTTSDRHGNIWMASYYGSAVVVYPKGNPSTMFPPYRDENTKPFHIMVDDKGDGWVSYTGTSSLSKLSMGPKGLVRRFTVPIGDDANPKGIGIDTKGNVWATAGKESKIYAFDTYGRQIGAFSGGGVLGPWGLSVDSQDHIWVANFGPDDGGEVKYRLSELCGVSTENCPAGAQPGDPISPGTGYTLPSAGDEVLLENGQPLYGEDPRTSYQPLMRSTATQIDMAGNVWVTNNWKPASTFDVEPIDGNPGGDGIVIFVGLAAPVKPGLGQPKAP